MRLLIVLPRQDRVSGNWVSAIRLQQGLMARGHAVALHDTDGTSAPLAAAAAGFRPDATLLLHAWRSGRPWLESGGAAPFAVLLTGTDVNLGLHDPAQAPGIEAVLARAAAILAQNAATVASLAGERPELAARLHHLPPGIVLGNAPFPLRERVPVPAGALRALCPAGIRPVKGVLELLEMSDPLAAAGTPLDLAFCGPVIDKAYGERFRAAVAARPWATWLGSIPPAAMPDAMRQADLVINNSSSEGLPNALVEAAVLGRPIVARDIPGNAAIVNDGGNGLLYRDAAGFHAAIRRLQGDPALRRQLSRPDAERFSVEREAATLEKICLQILGRHGERQL